MNTATAGSRNGTATLSLVSDASNVGGCEPNCQLNLPSQNVNITGGVYQIAQANVPADVNLGNVHVGSALEPGDHDRQHQRRAGRVTRKGSTPAIGGTSGGATAIGGPITNLARAAASNAISVGHQQRHGRPGQPSGQVTLNLASNGTGTSGLATLSLAPQADHGQAAPATTLAPASATPSPVTLANQRVGGSGSQALTVANTAAAGAFTEDLSASFGANSGNATGNGGTISGSAGRHQQHRHGSMAVGVEHQRGRCAQRHRDGELRPPARSA